MILLLNKRHLVPAGAVLCCLACAAAVLLGPVRPSVPAFAPGGTPPVTVVVDPGHGGEDGGAVAADGTVESRLNLEIALRVSDLLRLAGWRTVMTRTEDVSVHSAGAESIREKKASDLKNRTALVNGTENAVLLSIHQNSLPSSPETHGAQAFWNQGAGAEVLAGHIQDALNATANLHRAKAPRQIPPDIYLMKNVTAPGVLVECGFLTNGEEAVRLGEPEYQRKLAAALVTGFLRAAAEGT